MTSDGPVYNKFSVIRRDGTDQPGQKHDGCDYFVLDLTHDSAAQAALFAYALACRSEYPRLSESIMQKWFSDAEA